MYSEFLWNDRIHNRKYHEAIFSWFKKEQKLMLKTITFNDNREDSNWAFLIKKIGILYLIEPWINLSHFKVVLKSKSFAPNSTTIITAVQNLVTAFTRQHFLGIYLAISPQLPTFTRYLPIFPWHLPIFTQYFGIGIYSYLFSTCDNIYPSGFHLAITTNQLPIILEFSLFYPNSCSICYVNMVKRTCMMS